jgi:hypothetical protein
MTDSIWIWSLEYTELVILALSSYNFVILYKQSHGWWFEWSWRVGHCVTPQGTELSRRWLYTVIVRVLRTK